MKQEPGTTIIDGDLWGLFKVCNFCGFSVKSDDPIEHYASCMTATMTVEEAEKQIAEWAIDHGADKKNVKAVIRYADRIITKAESE